jgi:acyl dehydratase
MIEWFDDLVLGMRFKSSEKHITREDIKRFASEFDPQPFHLDEAAAERTPLKGLAASGWHQYRQAAGTAEAARYRSEKGPKRRPVASKRGGARALLRTNEKPRPPPWPG